MNIEEIYAHLRKQNWLLSMYELDNDYWTVTYHKKGTCVMSSHSSWGLIETMIYNIRKMETTVMEYERELEKKNNFFSGFISNPSIPFKRRI